MATRTISPVAQSRYDEHKEIERLVNAGVTDTQAWESQDEAREQNVVPLNTGKKYVFRSRPGTLRGPFSVRIPTLPDDFRHEREETTRTNQFNKRRIKVDGEAPKFNLDSVREKVGSEFIVFNVIPGGPRRQQTCFYATDDDEVYEFLMQRKRVDTSGKWSEIFVEYPQRLVEINGIKVPSTSAGYAAAFSAFQANPEDSQE